MRKSIHRGRSVQSILSSDPEVRRAFLREMILSQMRDGVLGALARMFREEVMVLCGPFKARKGPRGLLWRGGSERGSVYLEGRRVPVRRPRVRNGHGEHTLASYEALRDFDLLSEDLKPYLLAGVSTRDYRKLVRKLEEDLPGPSKATVSRAFGRACSKDLDVLNGRDLSGYTFAALVFDATEVAGVSVLAGVGVTPGGEKVLLGLWEGHSENTTLARDFLVSLRDRGLKTLSRVLVILDGSKGLRKGILQVLGEGQAVVQRCQVHKQRNVCEYLPKHQHAEVGRRLKAAYGAKTYAEAKRMLETTRRWLEVTSPSAARSLAEGLEETLTVHRLALPEPLRRHFRSTNLIESTFAGVKDLIRRVKRWRNTKQAVRWVAAGLAERERRFKKLKGYRALPALTEALQKTNLENNQETA